jgi:hypothetical protein
VERHGRLAIIFGYLRNVYVGVEAMKTIPYLFLDIDGVVNCNSTRQRHRGFIGIDPVLAAKVKRIIKTTGCRVVLSSMWRLDEESRAEVKRKVCNFIDVTGISPGGFRGMEVKTWLDEHKDLNIDRYAILDDAQDFYAEQPLFRTEWRTGITDEIAQQVIDHLMGVQHA